MQNLGYVDSACNYNDTNVTLTNCYQSVSDKKTLATYELDDFVINMAYLYTKDGSYSDEVIKSLMIVLKTNALSYGGYNSSNKNVDVRICDIFSQYDQMSEDGEDDLWMLEEDDEQLKYLTSLYEEISNYLYISSSYRSTISNLSSQNILSFNINTLNEFETLALIRKF